MTFSYTGSTTPTGYVCSACSAGDCKLWREYQRSNPALLCALCAGKDQNKSVANIDSVGTRPSGENLFGDRTNQIGWYVPAVPHTEGVNFHSFTSLPPDAYSWWERLPSLPNRA